MRESLADRRMLVLVLVVLLILQVRVERGSFVLVRIVERLGNLNDGQYLSGRLSQMAKEQKVTGDLEVAITGITVQAGGRTIRIESYDDLQRVIDALKK
jgi:hypothetical protein